MFSRLLGVGGRIKSQKNGLVTDALFFCSPRLALRSKCRVRHAWLIKRLSSAVLHSMQATVKKNYYENI